MGMSRRIVTYPDLPMWGELNFIATIGSYLMAAGVIVFIANVIVTWWKHEPAGDDPWGGYTLEWATTSPPPEHNFESMPPINSERPAFDMHHPELARTQR
jgi:heme/copper-type cytochrome/quinol oxidase subunit 1